MRIKAETASHLSFDLVEMYTATRVRIVPQNINDGGYCACDGDIVDYGVVEVSLLPKHTNLLVA